MDESVVGGMFAKKSAELSAAIENHEVVSLKRNPNITNESVRNIISLLEETLRYAEEKNEWGIVAMYITNLKRRGRGFSPRITPMVQKLARESPESMKYIQEAWDEAKKISDLGKNERKKALLEKESGKPLSRRKRACVNKEY